MATREQNEKEYHNWTEFPDDGRRYWRERKGKINGLQRMVKVVDAEENTVSVVQEIYDDFGDLIERHQKFPRDTGHQAIGKEE
jgi:hypothetical protein